jgi:uncharacterized protein
MRYGILLVFALAFARLEAQQSDDPSSPPSQIRTSATATRSVPPDLAIGTFEFSARGRTAGEAARAAGTTRDAIRQALTKAGVPEDSILTPGFDSRRGDENITIDVKPNSEFRTYDTAYVFRDRLVARMRDLRRLGSAIDAALAAGAQKVTSLQFSTTRSEKVRQEALSEASRQVRRNAELMAEAAGGKLGRLLDLSTDADRYQEAIYEAHVATMAVSGGSQTGTMIKPTNIDTRVSVSGRWEFVPIPKSAPGP